MAKVDLAAKFMAQGLIIAQKLLDAQNKYEKDELSDAQYAAITEPLWRSHEKIQNALRAIDASNEKRD